MEEQFHDIEACAVVRPEKNYMSESVGTLIPAGREVEGSVRLPVQSHALIRLLIHGDVFVHSQTGTLSFTGNRGLNPSGDSQF